ncbi:MAG TPA: tetratricopeptide repeat protein [Verrucomicrobiae bacterium]|nr:tetratricopeptide repeat protein [Verrucomicrobiae bacterium]
MQASNAVAESISISDRWRDAAVCLAVFLVALALRLAYLYQIESIPLFYNLIGDPRGYDDWAQAIAGGDWLGQGVFYQAPLYPYFLAGLQTIFGHDLWRVRVAQAALSAVTCSLLYLTGKNFFSRGAGLAAGLFFAFSAPAIFFAAVVDKTALDPFLVVLLVYLLSSTGEKIAASKWLAAGVVLGLLGLSRENALVWIPVIALWIWFRFASAPRLERARWGALFALGLSLILLPIGIRNLIVGGEFTLTTAQAGVNFFIGNNPDADGTYDSIRRATGEKQFEQPEATRLAEEGAGRSLSPREVSKYWIGRSWDYIRSQPGHWLRLLGKKWLLVWNVREIDDSDDFYLYQQWSRLLALLAAVTHFGVLFPLAAAGCALTWRQWRRLWLLYAMLGSFALSVALFYVFARYRFPLVPLLALFAGVPLVEVFALFRKPSRPALGQGAVALGTLAIALAFARWPLGGKPGPSAGAYNNLATAYAEQEKFDEAIASAEKALELDPSYGVAHYNLGNVFVLKRRLVEAQRHFAEAARLHPRFINARRSLGDVLAMRGDFEGAAAEYRAVLKIDPRQSEVHFSLGRISAAEGNLDDAAEHFRAAVNIDPGFAEAHRDLGRIFVRQGALERAAEEFRRALDADPGRAEVHENLAAVLAQQGKKDEAVAHYEEAVRIMRARRADTAAR